MPIKNIWSVLCRRSILDRPSNNISLIDGFEQISLSVNKASLTGGLSNVTESSNKIFPFEYELACLWYREKTSTVSRAKVKIEIHDPTGKKINDTSFGVEMKKGIKRLRTNTKIEHLFVTKPGVYWYKVFLKEGGKYKNVAELPLQIDVKFV